MKVPFSYLQRQFFDCDEILADVKKLVQSGDFTLGEATRTFEKQFAAAIQTKYAAGVGSGTDALFLSLKALDIGAGDEVITAVNTFVATVGAIETAGAKTVFVDCNEKYVMDVEQIESVITDRTKAIMPVHYSGQPCDMTRIMDIAQRYKLHVIEDACQAIGSSIDQQNCGTFGVTAGYSLHPLKNLNVWGDAGVIVTNSAEVYEKICLLRNHGMLNRDEYAFYAYNSRLDSLQAVVGNHMIRHLSNTSASRIKNAQTYDAGFQGLEDVITIPERSANERHVYHLYMLLVENRDGLLQHLHQQGVEAKIHYPIPLHLQQASQHLGYQLGDFPVAEAQAKSLITLPAHEFLTDEEMQYTIDAVTQFYR